MTAEDQRILDEAQNAAQACIDRGTLWLALHPFKHHRMRQRLLRARADLLTLRRRYGLTT